MSQRLVEFTKVINEGSTAVYTTGQLVDENGNNILASMFDSLTLTLVNRRTGIVINGRDEQNVLNANDVVVSAGGVLTYTLQPGDTGIIDADEFIEIHVATFKAQFNTTGFSNWDVAFPIRNLAQVA